MTVVDELARVLSDPAPPVPDAATRAAVDARAARIVRRRRATRGLAAVTCVAGLAFGVVAVTDAGSRAPDTVEAAAADVGVRVAVRTDAGVPPGVDLEVTLVGEAGTFHARGRTPGTLTLDDVPPGDYELQWEWSSDDRTASAVGRRAVTVADGEIRVRL